MDKATNSIAILKFLVKEHQVKINVIEPSIFAANWYLVELIIENEVFRIQVDDEYDDFKLNILPLSFCVVLRSLEEYKEAEDFLSWCKRTGIDSNNNALEYFRTLATILSDIENIIEAVDSQISDIEFTTNAGAAYEIRSMKPN